MSGMANGQMARLIALLLPLVLLGGALGSQYIGGLHPCEMCYWQRWPHVVAVLLAALSFVIRDGTSRLLTILAAVAIAISGAIGVYHAGVEAHVFQGLTTCTANGPQTLNEILNAPLVRCDQVQFAFLGISMAGWNAILSLTGAAVILLLLLRERRS